MNPSAASVEHEEAIKEEDDDDDSNDAGSAVPSPTPARVREPAPALPLQQQQQRHQQQRDETGNSDSGNDDEEENEEEISADRASALARKQALLHYYGNTNNDDDDDNDNDDSSTSHGLSAPSSSAIAPAVRADPAENASSSNDDDDDDDIVAQLLLPSLTSSTGNCIDDRHRNNWGATVLPPAARAARLHDNPVQRAPEQAFHPPPIVAPAASETLPATTTTAAATTTTTATTAANAAVGGGGLGLDPQQRQLLEHLVDVHLPVTVVAGRYGGDPTAAAAASGTDPAFPLPTSVVVVRSDDNNNDEDDDDDDFDFGSSLTNQQQPLRLPPNHWIPRPNERIDATTDHDSAAAAQNCFGVVYVRVLRAQRLPCPAHSSVHAVIRLLPWKGKVRTAKAVAFTRDTNPSSNNRSSSAAAAAAGVCVQWDHSSDDATEYGTAMVHAYSDRDSPVPTVRIDLMFAPIGVFEFCLCTLHLSCGPLLLRPNVPRRQWFGTAETTTARTPLIEIEAMFEPAAVEPKAAAAPPASAPPPFFPTGAALGTPSNEVEERLDAVRSGNDDADDELTGVGEDADDSVADRQSSKASTKTPTIDDRSQHFHRDGLSVHSPRKAVTRSKQHLLQLTTFWTPAFCDVCGKSLTSGLWKRVALRCEACKVDCCDDCRLQVDIQLPCGSDEAVKAVRDAIQNRLTVDRLLSVIAPFDDSSRKAAAVASEQATAPLLGTAAAELAVGGRGIGTIKLEFLRAHVLAEYLPAETDPASILTRTDLRLRAGDYYVRVAWSESEKTVRTRTVQQSTGRPSVESGEMRFLVPHYGTEFRIELIDASTDKPVGTGLITTQGMLQQQRDFLIEEKRVAFLSFLRPTPFTDMRRIAIELRAGLKSGFSSDFFSPGKTLASTVDAHATRGAGDVVGCVELLACLEEDLDSLFGQSPYECPPRPGEELNMSVFQHHLIRISNILDDVKNGIEAYRFVVSWKNPLVTGFSLYVFLRFCIWFNPAYIGSLPVFLLFSFMVYFATKRAYGSMKQKYIEREIEKNRKAENGSVTYDLHRPIGLIKAIVGRGRNIRSPELGLAGNVACRIYWDPTRTLSEKQVKKATDLDESVSATHDVGATTFVYAMNPTWDRMLESEGAKRLQLLMPSQDTVFDKSPQSTEKKDVAFPVLQPMEISGDLHVLSPWETSAAALVVEVQFLDLLNVIPGSEYPLGEVVVPFCDLVKSGELTGWFNVVGTAPSPVLSPSVGKTMVESVDAIKSDNPQLFLSLRWEPPPESTSDSFLETEREASYAIQEEMVRSALLSRQQKEKVNLLVSSMGALNSVRGISANLRMVQNTLGSALDLFESCIHGFDFTDPYKSTWVLVALSAVLLVLSLVSTRIIVMAAGLTQYAITFKAMFERWMRSSRSPASKPTAGASLSLEKDEPTGSAYAVWMVNAIRGLPTSEDLRKTYFWESRRLGARETESIAAAKRTSRMRRLWRVPWFSAVRMLTHDKTENLEWRSVFAVMQGHRLLWWRAVGDFDSGAAPLGRLFLAGHAGLSSPSPLELREISPAEVERVLCVFGSGSRVTILTQTTDAKDALEKVVETALSSKID